MLVLLLLLLLLLFLGVVEKLPESGFIVKVIDTKFDWHKIEYNGRYGYVSGVYVK